jgi:alpha-tubulin suppressor-like RCC1 family protein
MLSAGDNKRITYMSIGERTSWIIRNPVSDNYNAMNVCLVGQNKNQYNGTGYCNSGYPYYNNFWCCFDGISTRYTLCTGYDGYRTWIMAPTFKGQDSTNQGVWGLARRTDVGPGISQTPFPTLSITATPSPTPSITATPSPTPTASVLPLGQLWAWGRNQYGQVGDGTAVNKSSPVQIGSLKFWRQVRAGNTHSLAVTQSGTLWAWGRNNYGQLGLGNTTNYSSPKQVGALTVWGSPAAGNQTSGAIKEFTDQTLWMWGRNNLGQVGDSTTTNRSSPVQVTGGGTWKKVGNGRSFSIGLKTSGALFGWGYGTLGQGGKNNNVNVSSPNQCKFQATGANVSYINDFEILSFGGIALTNRNNNNYNFGTRTTLAYVWGRNNYFSLGTGDVTQRSGLSLQNVKTTWLSLAKIGLLTEGGFAIAQSTSGRKPYGWGRNVGNYRGRVAMGTYTNVSSPTQVLTAANTPLNDVYKIASGPYCTHFMTGMGGTNNWKFSGNRRYGQLGNNLSTGFTSPYIADSPYTTQNWIDMSIGQDTVLAIKIDPSVTPSVTPSIPISQSVTPTVTPTVSPSAGPPPPPPPGPPYPPTGNCEQVEVLADGSGNWGWTKVDCNASSYVNWSGNCGSSGCQGDAWCNECGTTSCYTGTCNTTCYGCGCCT